jgi:hypothetical protein
LSKKPPVPTKSASRRQRWQPIELIFGPAVFDGHVFAFDEARLFQALVGCMQPVSIGRCGIEKSNHRQNRLLRVG